MNLRTKSSNSSIYTFLYYHKSVLVRNYLLSAGALTSSSRRSGRALVADGPHFLVALVAPWPLPLVALVAPWPLPLVALVAGAPKKSRLLSQPAIVINIIL